MSSENAAQRVIEAGERLVEAKGRDDIPSGGPNGGWAPLGGGYCPRAV